MLKTRRWKPIGEIFVETVESVYAWTTHDQKITPASVKVEARTTDGTKVRLYSKFERGLRLQPSVTHEVLARPFQVLKGTALHFQRHRTEDGGGDAFFLVDQSKKSLVPLIASMWKKYLRIDGAYAVKYPASAKR
jgi:hypothetical protein